MKFGKNFTHEFLRLMHWDSGPLVKVLNKKNVYHSLAFMPKQQTDGFTVINNVLSKG